MRSLFVILPAFLLGAGVGVWWAGVPSERSADVVSPTVVVPSGGNSEELSVGANPDNVVSVGGVVDEGGDSAAESTVEEFIDNSPTDCEALSAHAQRSARRRAAREQENRERRDFLSDLNVDLLTSEQRQVHARFCEALAERDSAGSEIAALRATGKEVPAELQTRLADAEAVLRADRDVELRVLREAAARAAGLDETAVRQPAEDLDSIDGVMSR